MHAPPPADEGTVAEALTARPAAVAILAPTGRDGIIAERVLSKWHIEASIYPDVPSLCAAIEQGVGAVLLAEEVLTTRAVDALLRSLRAQPSWSDVPVVVLTVEGELSRIINRGVEALALHGNITMLERPIRIATLVTVIRAALRARERQYDLREHLRELQIARAAAEAANRAKLEFLAMMSHELRTPLHAIAGYADLLDLGVHGALNEKQRFDLQRIQKSQRHLLTLINGVLHFARVEAGNVQFELTEVPLSDLLVTAEALVHPLAVNRALHLEYEGCSDSLAVIADRDKVQQIVLNLLTNAIKFTDPGGCITIRCDASDESVHIRVTDTGRGIPPEKFEAIFDPFVQLDSKLTRSSDGVGLGLAISRDLARGMHGDLAVSSAVGEGSTFTLTLPRAPSAAGARAPQMASS
jgi:signal transduction histidine kinase